MPSLTGQGTCPFLSRVSGCHATKAVFLFSRFSFLPQ